MLLQKEIIYRYTIDEKTMPDAIIFSMDSSILAIGLLSNLLGFLTLILSKKLRNLAARNMHFVLFIIDFIILLVTLTGRVSFYNGYDFSNFSSFSCKMHNFFNRVLPSLSSMVLVFFRILKLFILKF